MYVANAWHNTTAVRCVLHLGSSVNPLGVCCSSATGSSVLCVHVCMCVTFGVCLTSGKRLWGLFWVLEAAGGGLLNLPGAAEKQVVKSYQNVAPKWEAFRVFASSLPFWGAP